MVHDGINLPSYSDKGGAGDGVSISSGSSSSSKSSKSSSSSSGSRAQWGGQAEFILTCIGYAVGLGNVWRFPYLTYRNGGGAFLIPYFLMLIFVGLPLFYLELCLGQFSSQGPISLWMFNPLMKGLGYSMVIVNTFICVYYNVIVCWSIYYFLASMNSVVPWATCDNWWNTPLCVTPEQAANLTENITVGNTTFGREMLKTPSEEYYFNNVLRMSEGIGEPGVVVWQLALTLLLAWLIVFFVLIKGISSLGKVVYFSSIFPYVLMTVMVIRGCTLDGAKEGILYYLTPVWDKLADPRVWSDAATQIFYSLSACTGGLIAMASYNKFDNNCLRDSILVPIINCLTSFYSGFAIFSILGFMAKQKGVSMDEVAADGPGLVFVVYPEGLQQLPIAPLWAVLFFFMMMTLGFSSEFSMSETFFSAIIDEFPVLRRSRSYQIAFRAIGTLCFYGIGLCMVTQGGFYVFNIFDYYTGGYPLLFCGLFEFIAVSYVYGYFKFGKDIQLMLGKTPSWFFTGTWLVISPLILLAVIVFMAALSEDATLDNYEYPAWGQGIGWLIVAVSLFPIPFFFLINYCRLGGAKVIVEGSKPLDTWGPKKPSDRKGTKYEHRGPIVVELEVTDASRHLGPDAQPMNGLQRVEKWTTDSPRMEKRLIQDSPRMEKKSMENPPQYQPLGEMTKPVYAGVILNAADSSNGRNNGIDNKAFQGDDMIIGATTRF